MHDKVIGEKILDRLEAQLIEHGFKGDVNRTQAHSLWVAACIFLDWECDTLPYDDVLYKLWSHIEKDVTFEEFDAVMCVGLC